MSEHTKNHRQDRRRPDMHGGDVSGTFCGRESTAIRTVVRNPGMENSTHNGKSHLAK